MLKFETNVNFMHRSSSVLFFERKRLGLKVSDRAPATHVCGSTVEVISWGGCSANLWR